VQLGRQHPYHQRFERRGPFAARVEAKSEIEAPRELVWEILHDVDRYAEWNPFTPRATTSLRIGAPVELEVHMPGKRTMIRTEWVNLVEPGQTICWGMHMAHPALLTANRWQELEELGPAATRYSTYDRFSGLLTPLVLALYGEGIRVGFQQVADALKTRAEAVALARTTP
jgi:hypothetical protein